MLHAPRSDSRRRLLSTVQWPSGLGSQRDENSPAVVREEAAECVLRSNRKLKVEIKVYKDRAKSSGTSLRSKILRLPQFKNLRRLYDDKQP
jgi:hypothetical protein